MKHLLRIISIVLLVISCNKKEKFDGPNFYEDGFESYDVIDSVLDGNNVRWSFFQNNKDGNQISIDSMITHNGNRSVKSEAVKSFNDQTSKASINKQYMAFWEGDVVRTEFWVYLVGNDPAQWMFIFDLEEKTPIGAGAGMRLALVDEEITLEHKYPNPNVHQPDETAIKFPRDQWVKVTFETLLSTKKKGYVKVWQNDTLVIEQDQWKTLPKDLLYVNQGSRKGYSQIEYGITANSSDFDQVMYVDDIKVEVID